MPTYLTPGIYLEELVGEELRPSAVWRSDCAGQNAAASPEIIAPGTAAFLGFTMKSGIGDPEAGIGIPVLIKSWQEFVNHFGEHTGLGYLPDAVHGFFANGGPACIVISIGVVQTDRRNHLPKVSLRDFQAMLNPNNRIGLGAIRPGYKPGLLCFPDLMALYQAGEIDMKGIQHFQQTMIDYCEYNRNCFAIIDSPPSMMTEHVREWRLTMNYDSSRAAVYYPWLIDSGKGGWGSRGIPPCGHIAGILMRTQIEHGVQKTPANEIVYDASDLDVHVTRGEQDMLNPLGINILQSTPSGEIRVWGARTLSSDSTHRLIKTRRVLMTIQLSIERAVNWAIFETLNRKARERICCTIRELLRQLWQAGALAGEREEDAYYLVEKLDDPHPSIYAVNVGLAIDAAGVFNHQLRVVFFTDDIIPDRAAPKQNVYVSATPAPDYSRDIVDERPPADIFISYSRRDWTEFVEPLVTQLRENGLSVWVDQHLLEGGQDWMDEINHALKLCRVMILCVSPDALQSRYVKMEYRHFFNSNKPILPVICHPTDLPAELSGIQFLPYSDTATIVIRTRDLLA